MSWTEIKKVNSNLDIPLDKLILEKGIEINDIYIPSAENANVKLVDIKGKGLIKNLAIYLTNKNDQVKITIDDEVVINLEDGYGALWTGIISRFWSGFDIYSANNSRLYSLTRKYNDGSVGVDSFERNRFFDTIAPSWKYSSEVLTTTPTDGVYFYGKVIDTPILFNKNFKVEIKKGYGNNYNATWNVILLD